MRLIPVLFVALVLAPSTAFALAGNIQTPTAQSPAPSLSPPATETGSSHQATTDGVTTPLRQAGQRAVMRVMEAHQQGFPANMSYALMASGDRICMLNFKVQLPPTVTTATATLVGQSCVTQKGAAQYRARGLPRSQLQQANRLLQTYPDRGNWRSFMYGVLMQPSTFPALQQLIETDAKARQRFIDLMVGHSAGFVDPKTHTLTFPNMN